MTDPDFYVALARYLAWPLVVLVIAILLARPIRRLIDGLISFELSSGKIKIRREFRAAAQSTQDAITELKEAPRPQLAEGEVAGVVREEGKGNPWLDLASHSPTIAVIRAWEGLSSAVFDLAESTTSSKDLLASHLRVGLSESLELLLTGNVVNPSFVGAVEELRTIRNRVAHGDSVPNEAECISFISSAWELVRACKAIKTVRKFKESNAG